MDNRDNGFSEATNNTSTIGVTKSLGFPWEFQKAIKTTLFPHGFFSGGGRGGRFDSSRFSVILFWLFYAQSWLQLLTGSALLILGMPVTVFAFSCLIVLIYCCIALTWDLVALSITTVILKLFYCKPPWKHFWHILKIEELWTAFMSKVQQNIPPSLSLKECELSFHSCFHGPLLPCTNF